MNLYSQPQSLPISFEVEETKDFPQNTRTESKTNFPLDFQNVLDDPQEDHSKFLLDLMSFGASVEGHLQETVFN